jgi:hypothetical protein
MNTQTSNSIPTPKPITATGTTSEPKRRVTINLSVEDAAQVLSHLVETIPTHGFRAYAVAKAQTKIRRQLAIRAAKQARQ